MIDFFDYSIFFGFVISLIAYWIGIKINDKWKNPFLNPLLIAIILIVIFLLTFDISYDAYEQGARYITYFLYPATVCLAVPMYKQRKLFLKYFWIILLSIIFACIVSLLTVLLLSSLLNFDMITIVSILPKSITTAFAIGISNEFHGEVSLTVISVVLTGIIGAVIAEHLFKFFRIHNPVAKGIAMGSSSHLVGTAKAVELGEKEGAFSSLATVISGLITVVLIPVICLIIFYKYYIGIIL